MLSMMRCRNQRPCFWMVSLLLFAIAAPHAQAFFGGGGSGGTPDSRPTIDLPARETNYSFSSGPPGP
jgi:hypothetical protein